MPVNSQTTPAADPLNLDLVLARLAESDDPLVRAWAEALRDRGEAGEAEVVRVEQRK